jgi:thioredoxin 1
MVQYLDKTDAIGEAKDGVSVVAFSAKWCPPCKVMDPIYEEASLKFPGLRFLKANQETVPELFMTFGVQALPTYLVMKDGKVIHRQVGALPASRFAAMLERFSS